MFCLKYVKKGKNYRREGGAQEYINKTFFFSFLLFMNQALNETSKIDTLTPFM